MMSVPLASVPTSCQRRQPLVLRGLRLHLALGFVVAFLAALCAGQGTDPGELQALFEVIDGINSNVDWKSQLSDPCYGSQQGIFCLPDDSGTYHVTNLEFGFVSDYSNFIMCSDDAVLHPAIAKLPYLQSLFIFNCFVNGSATIPKEIGQLSSSLQFLRLQGNTKLCGRIPPEMGNLTILERLVLTENGLAGFIPRELGNLSNLLQLDLSENRLEGTIPASLNSLRSLVILDLGLNLLSGELPPFGALTSLQKLVLSNNSLSGRIPEDFGHLSSLTYLDLSCNNLTGGIPPSFVNLIKLEDLFLEGNEMRATLPDSLGRMAGLVRLSLSNSGYIGQIPASLGQLVNLRVLLLHSNNLSGDIPSVLSKIPHLYQLDLSANLLTGPLPFSPGFVEHMGSNLLVKNNSGLCVPSSTLHATVATMGVRICDGGDSWSGMAGSPPSRNGTAHSSSAYRLKNTGLICVVLMLTVWTSSSHR